MKTPWHLRIKWQKYFLVLRKLGPTCSQRNQLWKGPLTSGSHSTMGALACKMQGGRTGRFWGSWGPSSWKYSPSEPILRLHRGNIFLYSISKSESFSSASLINSFIYSCSHSFNYWGSAISWTLCSMLGRKPAMHKTAKQMQLCSASEILNLYDEKTSSFLWSTTPLYGTFYETQCSRNGILERAQSLLTYPQDSMLLGSFPCPHSPPQPIFCLPKSCSLDTWPFHKT